MTAAEQIEYRDILCHFEDGIAWVTMNRPEKRNALSLRHMEELIDCFTRIGDDPAVRAVVLRGKGPAFCSGHDLREMAGADARFYQELFDTCTQLMEGIQRIPQPVIAEVQGVATAAGCQLAATCDLVVASEDATFATPGVRIGLFCSTPMVALTRAVGRKKALEMLLTGEPLTAEEAMLHGLVNKVVPAEALAAETERLARRIADASPLTIATGKQAFYRQIELEQAEAYAYTKEVMAQNATSDDAQEGIARSSKAEADVAREVDWTFAKAVAEDARKRTRSRPPLDRRGARPQSRGWTQVRRQRGGQTKPADLEAGRPWAEPSPSTP